MNVRWVVDLDEQERDQLKGLTSKGKVSARKIKRAQILLMADQGATDEECAASLSAGTATVYRIRRRFVEGGLDHALNEGPRPGGQRKTTAKQDARLTALACEKPPAGRCAWTLELLTDRFVQLVELEVSTETVRRRLVESDLKPWQKRMWCIPKVNAEYVARMEDVLDLYAEPDDPQRPVVCFDEVPVQLIGEVRVPIEAKPGSTRRVDYEYKRNGTANLFVFLNAAACWRRVKVTKHRAATDFAQCMKELVDVHYPSADTIRVVLDNLSTHAPGALYQAFEPAEARRILRRLEFHYTPKHGSWLNMVEIENGVLTKQCLNRRIGDLETLDREISMWEHDRNQAGATVKWCFTVDKARRKFRRSYPSKSL
jgi:transposase